MKDHRTGIVWTHGETFGHFQEPQFLLWRDACFHLWHLGGKHFWIKHCNFSESSVHQNQFLPCLQYTWTATASVCCRGKACGQSVGPLDCSLQRGRTASWWSSCGGWLNTSGRSASLSGPPEWKFHNNFKVNMMTLLFVEQCILAKLTRYGGWKEHFQMKILTVFVNYAEYC